MPFQYGTSHIEPAFPDRPVPRIIYGLPFPQLVADYVNTTHPLSRIYILASRSLSINTDSLSHLQSALGSKVIGTQIGMTPHTPWDEVLNLAQTLAPLDIDCLITLGAGSLTDAAKVICWMLANDTTTSVSMESLLSAHPSSTTAKPPRILHIAIPTSLSGGEYQSIAGVTRSLPDAGRRKVLFSPPVKNPGVVVLDPGLSVSTPERVWLSTGVRAVDHCVETLCSLVSNEKGDGEAEKGLLRLIPSLIATKKDPEDREARFESMRGVVQAMSAVGSGVPMGASHAIGHQLGPLGVGHGETSCILLPAVCKWNAEVGANVERQEFAKRVLLKSETVRAVLGRRFGHGEGMLDRLDLGDILDAVFRELGMPRTLKEVGVGRDQLEELARNSLTDHWIQTNAKPITETGQVMQILEMVVE